MMATSPRTKTVRSPWLKLGGLVLLIIVVLLAVVLVAKWMIGLAGVQQFMADYPGKQPLPESAPIGFPAWLGWQHFLNIFFLLLIVKSGWQVRVATRSRTYWTRKNTGLIRTKRSPMRISLDLWLHFSVDALWILNGIIFIVLLFASGQWMRIVPTDWGVIPNALSASLQYLSLDWPVETGWVNYNSLQLLAYFVIVFIATPLAIISGLRMSSIWPPDATKLNKAYPMEWARAVHFPVMLYFVAFTIVHVTLVLATGALNNLNHMYAGTDEMNWVGFWIFVASLVVLAAVWLLARPLFLRPIASLSGKVGR
ncbi:cytochrome b/b6 domain-containing protein [Rhodoglobus aureus]|uniref:Cytochrome b561 bacterial/Ni-hydrogenase domain-containing protein n=1 Tax=Rhodoglobus aureus TaxID=191497 RepID=A0ABP4GDP6_9MICO